MLRAAIEKAWYHGPGWLYLLLPLEGLFRLLSALRRRFTRPVAGGVPVIVVGNLAVGGSGKTPLVLAVAEHFRSRGYRVGIVSRGYGGNAPQYPMRVNADSDAAHCGDEPLLLARRSGLAVAVAPDRPAAVATLVKEAACEVIVSDDGLQHYRLDRQVEVVVIDGQRGLGNGHCLPVGPLREPRRRLHSVDICVVNGAAREDWPGYTMSLLMDAALRLDGSADVALQDWPAHRRRVHAVAGIGHPPRFFDSLRRAGFEVVEHAFVDHHVFTASDFRFDETLPIVMTEKDAVKCRQLAVPDAWYVPVTACLDAAFFALLDQRLADARQ